MMGMDPSLFFSGQKYEMDVIGMDPGPIGFGRAKFAGGIAQGLLRVFTPPPPWDRRATASGVHIYIYIYIYVHVCVCVYIYIHIYTYTRMYVYTYTHTHTHTHTQPHAHTHTYTEHIHAHTHTHTQVRIQGLGLFIGGATSATPTQATPVAAKVSTQWLYTGNVQGHWLLRIFFGLLCWGNSLPRLLSGHNQRRIQVHVYCLNEDDRTPTRKLLEDSAEHWHHLHDASAVQVGDMYAHACIFVWMYTCIRILQGGRAPWKASLIKKKNIFIFPHVFTWGRTI